MTGRPLRTLAALAVLLALCTAVAGARSPVFDDDEEESSARSDQHVATVPLEHAFGVRMLPACRAVLQLPAARLPLPAGVGRGPRSRPILFTPAVGLPRDARGRLFRARRRPPRLTRARARAPGRRVAPAACAGGRIQSAGLADVHRAQARDDKVQAAGQRADRAEQVLQRGASSAAKAH
jgi:hypothetical protein